MIIARRTAMMTTHRFIFLLVAFLLFPAAQSFCADLKLPFLNANSETYSNVTVLKVTATDVHFTHARGMGNAKLKDLDSGTQKLFRYDAAKATDVEKKQIEANAAFHKQAKQTAQQPAAPVVAEREAVRAQMEELTGNASDDRYAPSTVSRVGDFSPVKSL
jgi:hypothetical protein